MKSPHICTVKTTERLLTKTKNNYKPVFAYKQVQKKQTIMNALRNKVQLIGNLGMDPEVKSLDGGKKLAKMSIATNENYKNAKGEKVTETQWHNLIAWGKTAEIVEKFLKKGSEVAVEGKLINRNYIDKEGIKRYVTEIEVSEVLMLDSKK